MNWVVAIMAVTVLLAIYMSLPEARKQQIIEYLRALWR